MEGALRTLLFTRAHIRADEDGGEEEDEHGFKYEAEENPPGILYQPDAIPVA